MGCPAYARRLRAVGESLTVTQWSERTGLTRNLIRTRKRRGWSDVDAVTVPDMVRHASIHIPPGHPGSVSWFRETWENDDHAWYVVACHPDGLTLEQIAAVMGLTDERVRQIELSGLEKLRALPEIRAQEAAIELGSL